MTRARDRRRQHNRQAQRQQVVELRMDELAGIVERTKSGALGADEQAKLKAMLDMVAFVVAELKSKRTSLERLRKLLFGSTSEKTSKVCGRDGEQPTPGSRATAEECAGPEDKPNGGDRPRPGHGRNRSTAYTGANRVHVAHTSLHAGDCCPECEKGKLYPLAEPTTLVRIVGVAPLSGTLYDCDRLRCNGCGEVFTAPSPDGVGNQKYDETASSMVELLKYGCGLPFNRIEVLQKGMGIPLPASTQWDLVNQGARTVAPVFSELIRQAAQGEVLHNDDTTMKVLELSGEQRRAAAAEEETDARTGVFTSGIVATQDGHRMALFFTGAKHAGENLASVLAERAADLPPPIQMCDALPSNTAGDFDTILAGCIAHSRRRYVDVVADFPNEVRYVLETLRDVYKNDAIARARQMSAEERLQFHQAESGPLMAGLERWMQQQFDERLVEPNSGLGEAIQYMQKHWTKLTLFLRVPGAPLDNNVCERALKKAILHRKNALFYKTLNGAHVGDVFMSLIHTAELNNVPVFDYLVALQRHPDEIAARPADWMPWNYRATLTRAPP